MKRKIEITYGKTARKILFTVNPIKKLIIKTECLVHKYINNKALDLIKNEGCTKEYKYFNNYINELNKGAVWADQDFKSVNHFYHATKRKGLYGFSNALNECEKYYNKALRYFKIGYNTKAMFYLGVACHLIQDTTVPQHVNNKLLKRHRKFELWMIGKIAVGHHFEVKKGIKRYDGIKEYIRVNAEVANNVYYKYRNIRYKEERYMKIANCIIKQAQISTAGLMLDFYDEIKEKILL
ncbi:zinc dependent phospholipase C family protein [Clostridium aestuarii]|uniref:Phospholipase C n=1 Tax=Clostridium aestuarii TaxID=338193 RepID=A0ABT4D2Y9_9CLOT|nr:zinc dependent phospholipase C family protein [Clostridium aestuarii]MCY6484655.1 zinc dependent phospholipase C family protein [Clostridium aestuarii]